MGEVRDPGRAFHTNVSAPLVKWRASSTKEDFLPITLSCWPQSTSDGTQIVLEFQLIDDSVRLENVNVAFPAAPHSRPSISSVGLGEASYDAGTCQVIWHIPLIDKSERTGTLEFTASTDQASLLPYTFSAKRCEQTKCPMDIIECYHQLSKDKIDFAIEKSYMYS